MFRNELNNVSESVLLIKRENIVLRTALKWKFKEKTYVINLHKILCLFIMIMYILDKNTLNRQLVKETCI